MKYFKTYACTLFIVLELYKYFTSVSEMKPDDEMNCNLRFSRGFHLCQNQVFFVKWRSLRKFLSFIATVWQVLGGRIQYAQVRQTRRHTHLAGVHHGDLTADNPDHSDTEGKLSQYVSMSSPEKKNNAVRSIWKLENVTETRTIVFGFVICV